MSFISRIFGRGHSITPAQALSCITNRPMLMAPGALDVLIASASSGRMDSAVDAQFREATGGSPEDLIDTEEGVGFLTIRGPLFQRWGFEAWWYGGTSYDVIRRAFDLLMNDGTVTRVVLDIDSPGGMVSGCFELADHIFAARGTKPIDAVANDSAFSAAYVIASACDSISLPNSGGVGSVGVVATHVDVSRYEDRIGVTYTNIIAGDKKADYSPHAPLSESARVDLQAEVDRLATIFVDTVARNRGIDADAVRALQAGCLFGPAAISAGLADAIATLESVAMMLPEQADPPDNPTDTGNEPEAIASAASTVEVVIGGLPSVKSEWDEAVAGIVAALSAEDLAKIARAEVADAISASGLSPALAMALLAPDASVTPTTVDARIARAKALADICSAAGLPDVAAEYAAKNTDLETARAQLIAAKSEDGPEIVTSFPAGSGGAAASGIWGATIKKFGGKA
jgi:capsid assembly protease